MSPACDVELIHGGRACGATPARAFTAQCGHGHPVTGNACESCLLAAVLGCAACWHTLHRHRCEVTFTSAACLCGCGGQVVIATRSDARYGKVKGRPVQYVTGHNLTHAAALLEAG